MFTFLDCGRLAVGRERIRPITENIFDNDRADIHNENFQKQKKSSFNLAQPLVLLSSQKILVIALSEVGIHI